MQYNEYSFSALPSVDKMHLGKEFLPGEEENMATLHWGTGKLRQNKEFKKRRGLKQRQRQKAVILLVKRTKMIVLHLWHAILNISLLYSSKLLREMTKFKVLATTWTNYSESFSLTVYFK